MSDLAQQQLAKGMSPRNLVDTYPGSIANQCSEPQRLISTAELVDKLGTTANALRFRLSLLSDALHTGPSVNGTTQGCAPTPPMVINERIGEALADLSLAHDHIGTISRYLGLEV